MWLAAERMMFGATLAERYAAYREFIKAVSKYLQCVDKTCSEPQVVERVNRLKRLQAVPRVTRLQAIRDTCPAADLETSRCDYRDFEVPADSTVYADPPYRGTDIRSYGVDFDYDAFEDWLAEVDFPVFVSEYTCPKGCVEIAERDSRPLSAQSKHNRVVEYLFVQERFYDSVMAGGHGEE